MKKEIASYSNALHELQETLQDLLKEVERLPLEPTECAEDLVKLANHIDLIANAAICLVCYPEAVAATRH